MREAQTGADSSVKLEYFWNAFSSGYHRRRSYIETSEDREQDRDDLVTALLRAKLSVAEFDACGYRASRLSSVVSNKLPEGATADTILESLWSTLREPLSSPIADAWARTQLHAAVALVRYRSNERYATFNNLERSLAFTNRLIDEHGFAVFIPRRVHLEANMVKAHLRFYGPTSAIEKAGEYLDFEMGDVGRSYLTSMSVDKSIPANLQIVHSLCLCNLVGTIAEALATSREAEAHSSEFLSAKALRCESIASRGEDGFRDIADWFNLKQLRLRAPLNAYLDAACRFVEKGRGGIQKLWDYSILDVLVACDSVAASRGDATSDAASLLRGKLIHELARVPSSIQPLRDYVRAARRGNPAQATA